MKPEEKSPDHLMVNVLRQQRNMLMDELAQASVMLESLRAENEALKKAAPPAEVPPVVEASER